MDKFDSCACCGKSYPGGRVVVATHSKWIYRPGPAYTQYFPLQLVCGDCEAKAPEGERVLEIYERLFYQEDIVRYDK
jgi:hypothetical protein